MIRKFKNAYLKIGIHTAAEGTLLHSLHFGTLKFYKNIFLSPAEPAPIVPEPTLPIRPFWSKKSDGYTPYIQGTDVSYRFLDEFRLPDKIVFDLKLARQEMKVGGIALVLFMGLGDYFFITPLLRALRDEFKDIPIHAYISTSTDKTNAALISKLIEWNPDIDQIHSYAGEKSEASIQDWRNYDYHDVFEKAPADFLVVPVFYEYRATTRHRVYSLFETFSLKPPPHVLAPIIYLPEQIAPLVSAFYEKIKSAFETGCKGIVFVQLDARSTQYVYPHIDEVVQNLVEHGFLIISVTPMTYQNDGRVFMVDIKQFSIVDSIRLLKMVSVLAGNRLNLLTVTSVFGSVSAGLGIRNLQMWHAEDEAMPSMWYPVHHVIARTDYPAIPQENITVAGEDDYTLNEQGLADYKPDFVMRTFMNFLGEN